MPIFRRGNIWYCDYQTPDGKRRRRSLKTSDKKLAEELHDKLKYESWRIANLGGFHIATFEDACARWIKEKAEKKTLRDDKSRIAFWMESFAGKTLDEITEDKIYNAIENMTNRRHTENIKN